MNWEFIDLGLAAVLQAKVPKERILNFMGVEELLVWVEGVRRKGQNGRKISNAKRH